MMNKIHDLTSKVTNLVEKKQWPKSSAGRKMISQIPLIMPEQTIGDAQAILFKQHDQIETINYFYVIDEKKKFIGVFSIKELFRQKTEKKVKEFMIKTNLVKVEPEKDQERVAYLALHHNLKSIPVVDEDNTLIGIVPSDYILSILEKEISEDLLYLAGIYQPISRLEWKNQLAFPFFMAIKHRLPWLLIGLLGGILVARIIGFFEASLQQNLILAMFIPVIVYMSNATGSQTQAIFLRDLATHTKIPFKKYFLKQLLTCFFLALSCSLLLFLVVAIGWTTLSLAFVLSFSMLISIISASIFALAIPYLLSKFKVDPAFGSGPFTTIVQDILSIIIYFGIANWLL